MKGFLAIALAVVLVGALILAGCAAPAASPKPAPAPAPAPAPTAAPAPAPGPAPAPAPAPTPTAKPAPGKTWNLKLSHEQAPASYYQVQGHIPFAQAIEKATNGRVKVTIYDSSTLMKSPQIPEGVKSGIADMGWLFTGYFPGQYDFIEGVTLPFLFPNAKVGSQVTWNIYNKYPEIQKQFAGLKILAFWTTEPYFVVGRSKHYKTIDDWKGQKIRATGGPPTEMVKALGATPMLIGMPDNYTNLQKGVIDGLPIAAEPQTGFRLYEVATYYTYVSTFALAHAIVMNMDTWNSFPKDIQDAFTSIGEASSTQYGAGPFDGARKDMPEIIKKAGFPMNEYTVPQDEVQKWIDKAGKPIWDSWIKTVKAKGLNNAQEILDDILKMTKEFSAKK